MADKILNTEDKIVSLTPEIREELMRQKTSAFEVAEFIKCETARIKEGATGRDCSLVSVALRVVEALKGHAGLKKYGMPDDYLAEHITVVNDDELGIPLYNVIWSDIDGIGTKIGFWDDNSETLHLGLDRMYN